MKKVLFMVNRDFVLYNFRLELVECLLHNKYDVYICLPYGEKVDKMIDMGCNFIPVEIDNRGTNPFRDIKLLKSYIRLIKDVKPDVILMYTTKVDIYAGIASRILKIPYIMNISGLGTALEFKGPLQKIMISLYKIAAKDAQCLFFQNMENYNFFKERNIYKGKSLLIPGSGVNLKRWYLMEYPDDEIIEFLFIARVIKEKGIEEYLETAKQIRKEYPNTIFHVLGPCDGEYKSILKEYEKEGYIKYHGMIQDTRVFLKNAHCTIHPSFYPEGISNVCLESAACGRPVITTNRSGCKDTVDDGVTGFIFEQRKTEQLIECVRKFLDMSNEERKQMGIAGRIKMENEFSREIVVDAYMKEIKFNGL